MLARIGTLAVSMRRHFAVSNVMRDGLPFSAGYEVPSLLNPCRCASMQSATEETAVQAISLSSKLMPMHHRRPCNRVRCFLQKQGPTNEINF